MLSLTLLSGEYLIYRMTMLSIKYLTAKGAMLMNFMDFENS
jgi:hypothetical protein